MTTIKNTCLLIAVILQFSTSCFSQDSVNDYTDLEARDLGNYIANLKMQNSQVSASILNAISEQDLNIAKGNVLNDLIMIALDNDKAAIKLANYLIFLEKTDETDETAIVKEQFESIALIIVTETAKKNRIKELAVQ